MLGVCISPPCKLRWSSFSVVCCRVRVLTCVTRAYPGPGTCLLRLEGTTMHYVMLNHGCMSFQAMAGGQGGRTKAVGHLALPWLQVHCHGSSTWMLARPLDHNPLQPWRSGEGFASSVYWTPPAWTCALLVVTSRNSTKCVCICVKH